MRIFVVLICSVALASLALGAQEEEKQAAAREAAARQAAVKEAFCFASCSPLFEIARVLVVSIQCRVTHFRIFPRNLEPDFTHYLSVSETSKDKRK